MGKRKEAAKGMSFLELIDQDRWWKTRDGKMVRVDKMTQDHRFRLLAYLTSASADVARRKQRTLMYQLLISGAYIADEAMYDAEQEFTAWDTDPHGMMRATPLYRALLQACVDA